MILLVYIAVRNRELQNYQKICEVIISAHHSLSILTSRLAFGIPSSVSISKINI